MLTRHAVIDKAQVSRQAAELEGAELAVLDRVLEKLTGHVAADLGR